MVLVAGGIIVIALVIMFILHQRAEDRRADFWAAQALTMHQERQEAIERLSETISLLAARPLPEPPDLSFLESFVSETSRALADRMDTINEQQATLTTRVETGPGKRTINFP